MSQPDEDPVTPVVLQEPRRFVQEQASAQPHVAAHDTRWAEVLRSDEVVIWQGQASPVIPRLLTRLLQEGPVAVALSGLSAVIAGPSPYREAAHYLLTNRAAYIAQGEFAEVVAYPITRAMRLGLGGRAVTFATRPGARGEPEPVGFLDIPDAEAVYAMIRDIQKGQP